MANGRAIEALQSNVVRAGRFDDVLRVNPFRFRLSKRKETAIKHLCDSPNEAADHAVTIAIPRIAPVPHKQ